MPPAGAATRPALSREGSADAHARHPRALLQPLALSPDGTKLVYVAEDETGPNLYVREMDSGEVRKLPGTSYPSTPFFSPDGRSIGFFTTSELKTISVDQGSPVTLARVTRGIGGKLGLG